MVSGVFNYEKNLCSILISVINTMNFLNDKEKQIIFKIAYENKDKSNILKSLLLKVVDETSLKWELEGNIYYKIEDGICVINFREYDLRLTKDNLVKVLTKILQILEEILPLGTVVNLNEEFNKKLFQKSKDMKIIITHRFLTNKVGEYYFPYGGVPYPMGAFDVNRLIHFTAATIKDVVHMGFKDVQEEAYILLVKNKLVIDKGMNSIEFATKKEIEKYDYELKNA